MSLEKLSHNIYYGLLSAGIVCLVGSSFYLYNLLIDENNLYDEKSMIEDSNQSSSIENPDKILTKSKAIELLALIEVKTEEYLIIKCWNIHIMRREKLNDTQEYEQICKKIYEYKNESLLLILNDIRVKYGYTYGDITEITKSIPSLELEEKIISLLNFNLDFKPDIKFVIEAFNCYGNKFVELMKDYQSFLSDYSFENNNHKESLHYYLLVLEYKAEDELFLKYKIVEIQLKKMIFDYNLHKEEHIRNVLFQIAKYKEIFNM